MLFIAGLEHQALNAQRPGRRLKAFEDGSPYTLAALVGLDVRDLQEAPETVYDTMACLLKTREDKARMTREVSSRLLAKVA